MSTHQKRKAQMIPTVINSWTISVRYTFLMKPVKHI